MLASVLNSRTAIQASVQVVRAFVRLRNAASAQKTLVAKLDEIERRLAGHDADLGEQSRQLRIVFDAIRNLMDPPAKPLKQIGFRP